MQVQKLHGGAKMHGIAALNLQRTLGNAHVTRLLQRNYAVPPDTACKDVVPWLNANSPYKPEWAETRSTYSFVGQLNIKSENLPDGTVKVTIKGHKGLKVTVDSPVDRPTWDPSKRPNRDAEVKAWNAMRKVLDAHEEEHRKIAEQERVKAEQKFQNLDISATGATKDEAKQNAITALEAEKAKWQADAQKEQNKIDPFRGATLVCPPQPQPEAEQAAPTSEEGEEL